MNFVEDLKNVKKNLEKYYMMEHPDVHDDTRLSSCSVQHSRGDFKLTI